MKIREYQEWTQTTSLDTEVPPDNLDVIEFLNLVWEIGEYAEGLKKFYRDGKEQTETLSEIVEDWQSSLSSWHTYQNLNPKWLYMFLGALGELVEFFDAYIEHCDGNLDIDELTKEYGDLNYYISQIGLKAGLDQQTACWLNRDKLEDRKQRGVIQGDGDKR